MEHIKPIKILEKDNSLKQKLAFFFTKHKVVAIITLIIVLLLLVIIAGWLIFKSVQNLREKNEASSSENIDNSEGKNASQSAGPNFPGRSPLAPCFVDGKSVYERGIPNNRYGLYMVTDHTNLSLEKQLSEISVLVNSNGGDWGYVLIPFWITPKAYTENQWQQFFTLAEKYHLIPIIQLQTKKFGKDYMEKRLTDSAKFLNSFYWPSSCRLITVFNEMNALEYYPDGIDPEGYAEALQLAIDIFKKENGNFYMMNGALNTSARTGPRYLDTEDFMISMNNKVPGIFEKIDGWAAHAYPQPEFSGDYYNPPSWYGKRDQIKSYEWELELLQKHFNVTGLSVFITETGWAHKEGNNPKWQYKDSSITASYYDDAFKNIWGPDDRIKAIIPFIFNHNAWTNFNWMNDDGTCFAQCDVLKNLPKVKGEAELK